MPPLSSGGTGRFEGVVAEGAPRGGLHELEQTTSYWVVDRQLGLVVASFEGLMEASLSRETGLWTDYTFSDVCEVSVAPDDSSVHVKYYDGREEFVPLP